MGGGRIFLKNLRDTTFNKDLSNEPNLGRIHLAGQWTVPLTPETERFILLQHIASSWSMHIEEGWTTEPESVNILRSPGIDSQPIGQVRLPYLMYWPASAGIFKQSMGTRNREGIGCRTGPPGYIGCGIDSLEPIPGLLKSFKISSQAP